MLKAKGLANDYWGEVVATTVYLLNKSPTKAIRDRIPQEVWKNDKLSVEHLQIFRCVAYAFVTKEKRQKFDDKGKSASSLGTMKNLKATSCTILLPKMLKINRDVEFIKNELWDGTVNTTTGISTTILIDDEQGGNEEGGTSSSEAKPTPEHSRSNFGAL